MTVVFRVVGSHLEYYVGQKISFSDTEVGIITSIRSIKCISYGTYEVIGRYKPEEVI